MSKKTVSKFIVLGPRLTKGQFFLSEFCLYLAQFAVFFLVTSLISGFLSDEKALVSFLESKINDHTMLELGIAFGSLLMVLGLITLLSKGATNSGSAFLHRVGDEILHECPRLVSATGSTLGGTLAAAALYIKSHPQAASGGAAWWLAMSLFFSFIFFGMASSLSYFLKRSSHISDE